MCLNFGDIKMYKQRRWWVVKRIKYDNLMFASGCGTASAAWARGFVVKNSSGAAGASIQSSRINYRRTESPFAIDDAHTTATQRLVYW